MVDTKIIFTQLSVECGKITSYAWSKTRISLYFLGTTEQKLWKKIFQSGMSSGDIIKCGVFSPQRA